MTFVVLDNMFVKNAWGCWGYYYFMVACSSQAGCCNTSTEYLINRSEKVTYKDDRLSKCKNFDFKSKDIKVSSRESAANDLKLTF